MTTVPFWVRIGLTDLDTRRRAAWFRNASAALGAVMVASGFVEPQASVFAVPFFAVAAWVESAMIWMDARRAW